ncbi:hypothetical protein K2173_023320 [Erythroxylum novogranatense]|uniref:EXPERA domain-containing protein n=1 Tax=Erythroxylum novogranatense TaxID=1862640 RepID=A0AAV8TA07_9ROSI|nr:hypothetical protein K2173_023320 [Erythroxylum novogranatense]
MSILPFYYRLKLVDFVPFYFFFMIVVAAPLMDARPSWYSRQYDDYLIFDKPNWFVGLVWLELFFQWHLSLINLVGILGVKLSFPTTYLIYSSPVLTSMLMSSGKASDSPKMMYYLFFGFDILAVLCGLMSQPSKTTTSIGKRPLVGKKERV